MNSMLLQEKHRKKWIKIREQTTLFDVSKNTILWSNIVAINW